MVYYQVSNTYFEKLSWTGGWGAICHSEILQGRARQKSNQNPIRFTCKKAQ